MTIFWRATVLSALVFCAGCKTTTFRDPPPESVVNIYPTNWRAEIAAHIKANIRESGSVRDAAISEPVLAFMGAGNRYLSCVRFNAKNGFGGMTGQVTYSAVFVSGKLSGVDTIGNPACSTAPYITFGEIEGA
jgi:hypothetical protein